MILGCFQTSKKECGGLCKLFGSERVAFRVRGRLPDNTTRGYAIPTLGGGDVIYTTP